MTDEFLSICIPTRNRSHLLRDLLASLAAEFQTSKLTPEDVRVYVSDNASTDATKAVAHEILGTFPHFVYSCNEKNIGGVPNILICAAKGRGTYRWLIGDDEWLPPGTLSYLLSHLREHRPGWFIHAESPGAFPRLKPPRTFANVSEFVRVAADVDPGILLVAGGISFCTFREDCFDHALARSLEQTSSYPQFFGLLNGLRQTGASVFLTDRQTVIVRERRPAPSGGELPLDSDSNWFRCLQWVKQTFDLPHLDPEYQSRLVSRQLMQQLRRHPWKTLRNHAAFLRVPGAYPRILKRLWYAIKP
jgi:glycosyltransferase involved in cell wall biosynthesis